jgi:hypothetical protein
MEKLALLSLSNDLKRIVTALQRGSLENAARFEAEAKRWLKQASSSNDSYTIKLLKKVELVLNQENNLRKAEDCLMYSVLLQNQALAKK